MEEKGEKMGGAASKLATFTELNLTKKHAAKNTEINLNTQRKTQQIVLQLYLKRKCSTGATGGLLPGFL